jgi:AraC-like DNA-binding protein
MLEQTRPDGHGRARGLVSSRVSGQRVEAATFAPSPALAGVVETYWMTRWNLDGQPSHLVEVLTDPCVHVAFEAGKSRVVGVNTKLFRRELLGAGLIRAVKLKAGAGRALLPQRSITAWNDRVTPLREVFSGAGALERRVLSGTDQQGFVELEAWLGATLRPGDAQVRLAVGVVERITKSTDVTTVKQVCGLAGLSTRPLQRLFRDFVGVSPKWVIRRQRLRDLALRLERGGSASLADLAADLGYADHAHLTRDFKRATGRAPSEFARAVWK